MVTSEKIKWIATAALLVLVAVAMWAFCDYRDRVNNETPKVLTETETRDPEKVARAVNVSTPTASELIREIDRAQTTPPAATFYITAPTVPAAATTTMNAIKRKDPSLRAAATKKSDRTVVVSNDTAQKVDVYKVNLRKIHKIKTGMTYIDDHAYANIGYQCGRWEGIVHFDRTGARGGSVMYTVKEW
nr:MAG TPA: hypothetical protein [Bacteriophage sp.]